MLWFVIAGEKTSERGLAVPVELQNFPRDLELTGDPVNTVEVRLRASPGIIHALGPGEVSAQIDLAGAGEGERIVHLTPESIRVPFGVRVVKITPSHPHPELRADARRRSVPVRPRLIGRPAPGYEVAEVTSEPAEVRIAGPKSRVQEVESAFTEPVSVEGAAASRHGAVNIGLEDPLLRLQGAAACRSRPGARGRRDAACSKALPVAVRGGVGPAAARRGAAWSSPGPSRCSTRLEPATCSAYVDLVDAEAPGATLPVAVELASGLRRRPARAAWSPPR